jgi:hypothetical protein
LEVPIPLKYIGADMWLVKYKLNGLDMEQQYQMAKEISDHAENTMVKHDIAEYLANAWNKPLDIVKKHLDVKTENAADKMKNLYNIETMINKYLDYLTCNTENEIKTGYREIRKVLVFSYPITEICGTFSYRLKISMAQ